LCAPKAGHCNELRANPEQFFVGSIVMTFLRSLLRQLTQNQVQHRFSGALAERGQEIRPLSNERVITGTWVKSGSSVVGDAARNRVEALIGSYLQKIAVASTGWATLYRDPGDLRLWEHTCPHSEMHGGGPPQLQVIDVEAAKLKYGDLSASLNERGDHGMTPLLWAVIAGDVERVQTLLEQGADPNRTASDGTSALWLAEDDFGLAEVARVLREFGATKK
jgi:hypothetical protein